MPERDAEQLADSSSRLLARVVGAGGGPTERWANDVIAASGFRQRCDHEETPSLKAISKRSPCSPWSCSHRLKSRGIVSDPVRNDAEREAIHRGYFGR